MKCFILFGVMALLGVVSLTKAQEEPIGAVLGMFLQKSEYIHKVLFQLLSAKIQASVGEPIPEPMHFDNFTFNHFQLFQEGVSHTYNPELHDFSLSQFTVQADQETFAAQVHLFIPKANLTGTYDLDVVYWPPFGSQYRYEGAGSFMHVFHGVDFWVNMTVGTTADGSRALPTDVHSHLSFRRCELWAENYMTNGIPWDAQKWISQSATYKVRYDELAPHTDIILSATVTSYFDIFWGIMGYSKADALQSLLEFGEIINP